MEHEKRESIFGLMKLYLSIFTGPTTFCGAFMNILMVRLPYHMAVVVEIARKSDRQVIAMGPFSILPWFNRTRQIVYSYLGF